MGILRIWCRSQKRLVTGAFARLRIREVTTALPLLTGAATGRPLRESMALNRMKTDPPQADGNSARKHSAVSEYLTYLFFAVQNCHVRDTVAPSFITAIVAFG